jgi:hypothetical protein
MNHPNTFSSAPAWQDELSTAPPGSSSRMDSTHTHFPLSTSLPPRPRLSFQLRSSFITPGPFPLVTGTNREDKMRNRSAASPQTTQGTARVSAATKSHHISTATWIIIVIFSSCISFYVGVWSAWSITSSNGGDASELCVMAANGEDTGELGRKIGDIFKTRLDIGEMYLCLRSYSYLFYAQAF